MGPCDEGLFVFMIDITPWEFVQKYLDFFESKGHAILPNVNLVPKEDPTTLFVNSGVQPIEKYLAGEPHPLGRRLASIQRCVRTGDLEGPAHDSVGDSNHHILFHMLGNWSLGDYFKNESLSWSYEFLIDILGISPDRLWVTIFEGDEDAPFDAEAQNVWLSLGIPAERIIAQGKQDNWWGPAGITGPCGPDSEIFFDRLPERGVNGETPSDAYKHTQRFNEIWNNVFSQYFKDKEGRFTELSQKNVDTGMGLERTIATLQGYSDNYQTSLFLPMIECLEGLSGKRYPRQRHDEWELLPLTEEIRAFRIIAEHARASVFLVADGVIPANKEQGYVLRRLVRRMIRFSNTLGVSSDTSIVLPLIDVVVQEYGAQYPVFRDQYDTIVQVLREEEQAFVKALQKGKKLVDTLKSSVSREDDVVCIEVDGNTKTLGEFAFFMFETHGFPKSSLLDALHDFGIVLSEREQGIFEKNYTQASEAHKAKSKTASAGRFAGGLADHSVETTRLHTATHLLHKALREVLGEHVQQKGSNITKDRLRFDFSHDAKMTPEEKQQVEEIVNGKISASLPVVQRTMEKKEALDRGALAFFGEKYPDTVSVYSIGDLESPYSMELCGGPHVENTHELGAFKIIKEESVGKGMRRIKATVS